MQQSQAERLADASLRLWRDLDGLKPDNEQQAQEKTLAIFAEFARSCGLEPAAQVLLKLSMRFGDLNYGRVHDTLKPKPLGRGNRPDATETWLDRVLVLCAMKSLQLGGVANPARWIADRCPEVHNLVRVGEDVPATIEGWERKIEDAADESSAPAPLPRSPRRALSPNYRAAVDP